MFRFIILNKEIFYNFFVYLIIFLSSIFPYGDKDWGWHYKYGEYFFTNGKILLRDSSSWTMPNFAWTNHSWIYDLLLYVLNNSMGFIGLAIMGGLINLLSFYFIISNHKLVYWKKMIIGFFFLLIGEVGIMYGLRSQVISNLFFAILMALLIKLKTNHKLLFSLPLFFLVWVNIHGDYPLGLGITGIFLGSYFLIEFYKTKKLPSKLLLKYSITLVFSFAATLINPYNYRIYLESLSPFKNLYLKNVYEWLPIYYDCSYCHFYIFIFYCIILFSFFIIYLKQKKLDTIPYIILFIILIYPTIDIRRFLPIFCIVTLPFLADALRNIKWDFTKLKMANYVIILIIIVGLEINLFNRFINYNLYNFTEDDYCYFSSRCSPNVVNYLIKNPPLGKGFNFYDWGGYLVGKGLPAKIFISGLMHHWTINNHSVFGDYISMYYKNDYTTFKKYNFDWALIPDDSELAQKLYFTYDLGIWKLEFKDGNTDYFVKIK